VLLAAKSNILLLYYKEENLLLRVFARKVPIEAKVILRNYFKFFNFWNTLFVGNLINKYFTYLMHYVIVSELYFAADLYQ
jgi:hypothetical protein